MPQAKKFELQHHLPDNFKIGQDFFDQVLTDENCCIFLMSCSKTSSHFHLGTSTKDLIGYTTEQFGKGGIHFWFSIIDQRDLPFVSDAIVTKFRDLLNPTFWHEPPSPLVLRYRLTNAFGETVWIKDTRYILSPDEQAKPEQILCKIEMSPISAGDIDNFDNLLTSGESFPEVLAAALLQKKLKLKQPISHHLSRQVETPQITKREKEILMLVGEGLSSKMIADRCNISINTVETHRRHLLEKLNAKNSMELIRQASRIFTL